MTLEKIILDLGAIISVGLLIVFTYLAIIWNRNNYFWGTVVFILVSIAFSMRRFRLPGASQERKNRYTISFQSMGYFTTVEDKKALDNLSSLVFRAILSAIFLVFIPFDLVIQLFRLVSFDDSNS